MTRAAFASPQSRRAPTDCAFAWPRSREEALTDYDRAYRSRGLTMRFVQLSKDVGQRVALGTVRETFASADLFTASTAVAGAAVVGTAVAAALGLLQVQGTPGSATTQGSDTRPRPRVRE